MWRHRSALALPWMNPFSLAVAQGVAGIPVMSGAGFRIVLWVIFTATAIIFTMRYAVKIKRTRSLPWHMKPISITAMIFSSKNKEDVPFTFGHKLLSSTIVLTMAMDNLGRYCRRLLYPGDRLPVFVMGLVSGIIGVVFKLNDMKVNDIAKSFDKGAAGF